MSITTFTPTSNRPSLCSHELHRTQFNLAAPPSINLLKLKPQPLRIRRSCSRLNFQASASVSTESTPITWIPAPLVDVSRAAEELMFNVNADVSQSPELGKSFTKAGQFLKIRVKISDAPRPALFYVTSPPGTTDVFEFLVKSVPGTTAGLLPQLKKGDVVELTKAMGQGFDIDQISPPKDYPTVLMFATGYSIGPIRSLIESGFFAELRPDVRLYYGARNQNTLVYQDRFDAWKEEYGIDVVTALTQPLPNWNGVTGTVVDAFENSNKKFDPKKTGAILCGQPEMIQEVKEILLSRGVPAEKILTSF